MDPHKHGVQVQMDIAGYTPNLDSQKSWHKASVIRTLDTEEWGSISHLEEVVHRAEVLNLKEDG